MHKSITPPMPCRNFYPFPSAFVLLTGAEPFRSLSLCPSCVCLGFSVFQRLSVSPFAGGKLKIPKCRTYINYLFEKQPLHSQLFGFPWPVLSSRRPGWIWQIVQRHLKSNESHAYKEHKDTRKQQVSSSELI